MIDVNIEIPDSMIQGTQICVKRITLYWMSWFPYLKIVLS